MTTLSKGKQTALEMFTEMVIHKQTIHMYGVTDTQLNQLMAGYTSLHLVFFGICFGAWISLVIPLFCNAVPKETKIYFFAAALVSGGLAVWAGLGALAHWGVARKIKSALYKQDISTTI
jgi:hypothetical protein